RRCQAGCKVPGRRGHRSRFRADHSSPSPLGLVNEDASRSLNLAVVIMFLSFLARHLRGKGPSYVVMGNLEAQLLLDKDDVDPVGQIFPVEDQLLADEAALAVGQLGALIL